MGSYLIISRSRLPVIGPFEKLFSIGQDIVPLWTAVVLVDTQEEAIEIFLRVGMAISITFLQPQPHRVHPPAGSDVVGRRDQTSVNDCVFVCVCGPVCVCVCMLLVSVRVSEHNLSEQR